MNIMSKTWQEEEAQQSIWSGFFELGDDYEENARYIKSVRDRGFEKLAVELEKEWDALHKIEEDKIDTRLQALK